MPGLTETKIRTHEPAVANFDVVQIAEAAPSSTTAANPMESEVLWKGVSMFNAMMWGGSIVSSKAGIDALASAGFEEPGVLFGALDLGVGDLVASLVPLSFGAGWYVLGQTMKDHPQDTLPSTAIQLGMTALANIGWLAWQKGGDGAMELGMQLPQVLQAPGLLGPLCFSALVGNVLTMWLANEALRRVKGSDVALIAASEPLWAAVAAMALLGDVLQPHEILGGALLIGAVVCNETLAEETAEGVDAPESERDLLKRASLSAPYFARMAVHLRRGSKLVLPTVRSASPSRSRDRN